MYEVAIELLICKLTINIIVFYKFIIAFWLILFPIYRSSQKPILVNQL